ncbi:hypothetical protein TB1_002536 [Malus domestica]
MDGSSKERSSLFLGERKEALHQSVPVQNNVLNYSSIIFAYLVISMFFVFKSKTELLVLLVVCCFQKRCLYY